MISMGFVFKHDRMSTISTPSNLIKSINFKNTNGECLRQIHNCSAILWREQLIFDNDDEVRFVLDQYAQLHFYSRVSSLKQQQTSHSTRTYYPDSGKISLCAFFLMLRAQQRSNKYLFLPLWYLQTLLTVFGSTQPGLELTIYNSRSEHANHLYNRYVKYYEKKPLI